MCDSTFFGHACPIQYRDGWASDFDIKCLFRCFFEFELFFRRFFIFIFFSFFFSFFFHFFSFFFSFSNPRCPLITSDFKISQVFSGTDCKEILSVHVQSEKDFMCLTVDGSLRHYTVNACLDQESSVQSMWKKYKKNRVKKIEQTFCWWTYSAHSNRRYEENLVNIILIWRIL